jgi:hypothetical protein
MLISVYMAYLAASAGMLVWAGQSLNQSGRVYLMESFKGNEAQAESLNRLLLTGFYLFGSGFICLMLNYGDKPDTLDAGIEFLAAKLGMTILVLGCMHFIGVFTRVMMKP